MNKCTKIFLSAILSVAMVGMATAPAQAAAAAQTECDHWDKWVKGYRVVSCSFAGPDGHMVEEEYTYYCNDCHKDVTETEYYYESHDYCMDYENNMFVCYKCGDSYACN